MGYDRESLGTCPICGDTIEEEEQMFICNGWKSGCRYNISKNDKYLRSMKKMVTKEMVQSILRYGEVEVDDLISKKGNRFTAILSYNIDYNTGYYNWSMRFPEK